MEQPQTLARKPWARSLNFVFGLGMITASFLTIRHFFLANYPASIYLGSFCDINAFFNCESSAFSVISQIKGVPLGYFGLIVGALVSLGSVFPSLAMERTNKTISLLNVLGVISLLLFSVLHLGSLCLLCSGYYVFSIASFVVFAFYGIDADQPSFFKRYSRFSLKYAATYAVIMLAGAYGMYLYHEAKKEGLTGVASHVVDEYFNLPTVKTPSVISPFMTAKATEKFEDAPIQVIEYADFRCPDCLLLYQQLSKLKQEFKGKVNIAFQFFPLEGKCNDVVDKNLHPGACELAYIAAKDPAKFVQVHDEIFDNFASGRNPAWRQELAKKYNAESAGNDPAVKDLVYRIVQTGKEYEKTSERFPFGIRSTPTMILNNRLVIGTLPYGQLKAIFQALVDRQNRGNNHNFMENWVPTK